MIPFICRILKNQKKWTAKQNKTRLKETKNKMRYARGAGSEEMGGKKEGEYSQGRCDNFAW